MPKFTIELPETFAVESRGVGVEVPVEKLSTEIVRRLALHGLTQKVGDAASGALKAAGFEGMKFPELSDDEKAKVKAKAKELMVSAVDTLVAGEWSERREGGASVSPLEARIRKLFGEHIRTHAPDVWKTKFKPLDPAERGKALMMVLAEQDDAVIKAFEADAATQLEAEAKAKAKLAKVAVKVNL